MTVRPSQLTFTPSLTSAENSSWLCIFGNRSQLSTPAALQQNTSILISYAAPDKELQHPHARTKTGALLLLSHGQSSRHSRS